MTQRRETAAEGAAAVRVRLGGAADRAFVVDLGSRTANASVSTRRPASDVLVVQSYERLVDFVFESPNVILVAEDALAPLGYLLLLTDMPDEVTAQPQAFVAYMAVEPHARRRGVAAALLREAERQARARGLPYLALMVTEDNDAARELYAQAGFSTERRLLCKPL